MDPVPVDQCPFLNLVDQEIQRFRLGLGKIGRANNYGLAKVDIRAP